MISIHISPEIHEEVPNFKIGVLTYYDIDISDDPQTLRKQRNDLEKELTAVLEKKSYAEIPGLGEWRKVFKALGIDPSRYRPSAEALYRRVKKGDKLPAIHSAADVNNYFSLKYEIPLGIYDLDRLADPIEIRIGRDTDSYEGINGREMNMRGKLLSADQNGAFGSPIVDSKQTMTTEQTKNALQLVYLRPSMTEQEAGLLLEEIGNTFEQIHGGTRESTVLM